MVRALFGIIILLLAGIIGLMIMLSGIKDELVSARQSREEIRRIAAANRELFSAAREESRRAVEEIAAALDAEKRASAVRGVTRDARKTERDGTLAPVVRDALDKLYKTIPPTPLGPPPPSAKSTTPDMLRAPEPTGHGDTDRSDRVPHSR